VSKTFRPSRNQCRSELVNPYAETTWRAQGEFLRGGTNSSSPSPSGGESIWNSIWARAALPMRLPPRLLGALLSGAHRVGAKRERTTSVQWICTGSSRTPFAELMVRIQLSPAESPCLAQTSQPVGWP
jgi:hypothetical protein